MIPAWRGQSCALASCPVRRCVRSRAAASVEPPTLLVQHFRKSRRKDVLQEVRAARAGVNIFYLFYPCNFLLFLRSLPYFAPTCVTAGFAPHAGSAAGTALSERRSGLLVQPLVPNDLASGLSTGNASRGAAAGACEKSASRHDSHACCSSLPLALL